MPDLANNIKCGNSLIGPDFHENQQMSLLDDEEMYRVNAFDWEAEFPKIMQAGGFDAVIGNPPYIRIQAMKIWAPIEVEFYKKYYEAASKGNYDIYVVFVEKALQLLNRKNGIIGYILPHKFFEAKYGIPLRKLISDGRFLSEVVHFGDQQVFAGATTYTCLLFLNKKDNKRFHFVKAHDLDAWTTNAKADECEICNEKVTGSEWNFSIGPNSALFEKLSEMPIKLGDVAHIFVGLQTDADGIYIVEEVKRVGSSVFCRSKETGQVHEFENNHLKRFAKGSLNIRRYHLSGLTKRLIFPYEMRNKKSVLLSAKDYQERYPLTWAYLEANKSRLSLRGKGRLGNVDWFGYVYKKNHTRFNMPKLLVPSIAKGSCFAADIEGKFYFVGSGGGGGGGCGITLNPNINISYHYLLGVLNSKVSSYLLSLISTPFRGGYLALNRQYIEQLPIRIIDFKNSDDKADHDQMVNLVNQMLAMNKKLAKAKTPQAKNMLQRQIETTDKQIDQLVYKLYDLTNEEIKIVESET
ncbi:MAG: Eco57I restriction-modification methylase domain-containing protein [Deltaproteobacteria bacterium]|nr:Eco57I restriction-modification methylase domain-containing protein [Deltaproteobacteria bacterium]